MQLMSWITNLCPTPVSYHTWLYSFPTIIGHHSYKNLLGLGAPGPIGSPTFWDNLGEFQVEGHFWQHLVGRSGVDRTGAGMGVGMLRGTPKFLGNLKDSKIWSSKNTKIPSSSKIIQKFGIASHKYFWFSRIYLCFWIINNYSRFTKIPPSYFSVTDKPN